MSEVNFKDLIENKKADFAEQREAAEAEVHFYSGAIAALDLLLQDLERDTQDETEDKVEELKEESKEEPTCEGSCS
jgi:hypothetical protein